MFPVGFSLKKGLYEQKRAGTLRLKACRGRTNWAGSREIGKRRFFSLK